MQKTQKQIEYRLLTIVTVCIVLMASFLIPTYADSQDLQETKIVKVGYIDYGGFIDQDNNGDYYGYCVDYLSAISNYTGWKYEYVYDSFANLLSKLETGEIDILCQTQKTPEREEKYLFSDYQVGVEIAALYVSEENSSYYFYDDAKSLNGMTVAMMAGSSQNEMFTSYAADKGFDYEPIYYDTVTQCFDAVIHGDADGLVMGSLAGQDKKGLRVAGRFSSDPYYVMTGRQNEQLLEQINEAQNQLTLQQPYLEAELYQKYYENTAAFSGILYTREEGEYIASNPSISIALKSNSIPLSDYSKENGEYGIFWDILESLSNKSGLTFQYIGRSDEKSSEEFLNENEDYATMGVFKNAANQEGIILSDTLYTTSTALVGKSGQSYFFEGNDKVYTIAIPQSYSRVEQYIREQYPKYKIKKYPVYEDCLKSVMNKEADYAALTLDLVTNKLDDPHYRTLSVINATFMTEDYCLAMKNTNENRLILSIINKSFRALPNEATEQIRVNHTIMDRYEMNFSDIVYLYRYQIMLGSFLILLVIILMAAYIILRNNSMKKIKQSAEKAEKANKAKSEFLARMSHDIRTPLNAVLGYARLAKMEIIEGRDAIKDISQIEDSGNFLLGLVNDVLDMSKIESGAVELLYEPVSVVEFENQIKSLFSERCKEKNITLHIQTEDAIPYIRVDKLRFKQIFFNLLSNAIKFTKENGNIWFVVAGEQIEEKQGIVRITVKDDGIGMSREFQEHLFEPFSQERTSASGMEGSGLGLSIVKQLVTLMEGKISCQSEKSKGAEFTVEIPTTICTREDIEFSHKPAGEKVSLRGKKILLCEDHPINAALAQRLLKQEGMEVVHAQNGKIGLEMFAGSKVCEFDAILMDIRMPVMDGIEATKEIRSLGREDAKTIPIIALTANAYDEDREQTKLAGMNAHVAKPFQPDVLYRILEEYL